MKNGKMKKLFTILALGLLLVVPAQAQFNFGLKAGLNLAGEPTNIDENTVGKKDSYTGFFVGPMAKFSIPLVGLGVEGDLLYCNSGTELGGETAKRQTLEIPILIRYELNLPLVNKIVVPFVAVGPQFGFNISSDDIKLSNLTYDGISNVAGKYSFRTSTTSLDLGLGAVLLSHIQLYLDYNIPLGTTGKLKYTDATNPTKIYDVATSKTKTWQISAAYIF